jgi:membrane protein DedA with SNARE-associated domain
MKYRYSKLYWFVDTVIDWLMCIPETICILGGVVLGYFAGMAIVYLIGEWWGYSIF